MKIVTSTQFPRENKSIKKQEPEVTHPVPELKGSFWSRKGEMIKDV